MKLKTDLLSACKQFALKRIENYKNEIATIKDSIENNDKGSDEDDSGNGKLFIDMEKNMQHLSEATKMSDSLDLINPKLQSTSVALGSIVKTNQNNFFISISAGKIDLDLESYFAISINSPIGMLLKNKSIGDEINFNGNSFKITEVI